MFRLLSVTPNSDIYYKSTLLASVLAGTLFLTGCQQQSETQPATENSQTSEETSEEDSQTMPQSDSAKARIKQFQPIYVTQALGLQRRLQAEYESLEAADAADSEALLLDNDTGTSSNVNETTTGEPSSEAALTVEASGADAPKTSTGQGATTTNSVPATVDGETDADINTSTEVGERDLTVLKRISLEPRKPVMLTEDQIIERYQQTMDALYQPVTTPLSAEDSDTLIDIATLVPQLFEHAEIAGRVSAKSPALARLIIQHQVWEQIEAQQVIDMQQMKLDQQKEFETLMSKFNETIEGYDEQIAKYEQTLKEFK